jgi:DtxR family Mn-dependent transcriptional regulator
MSTSTEEYLEALYNLTRDGGPASTSAISKRLNIAPASVTEMVQKLAETGYVNYSPYQGVTLTHEGYRIAEKMTRKHRLLERFLHDVLKIGNDKVHQEACEMEHALSDETARAMCRILKAPYKCPDDGQVIPPCDLGFASCDECRKWGQSNLDKISRRKENIVAISSLKEGQEGVISFIRGDSKSVRKLVDLGLTPGTTITVTRVVSPDGTMEISCRGSSLVLDDEIICNVFI